MLLAFPNFETLQWVISSATLPEKILRTPVSIGYENDACYVQSSARLSKNVRLELQKSGVRSIRKAPVELKCDFSCWHELIPLCRRQDAESIGKNTPAIFLLNDANQLAELASEMMRLGNDRQSFRYLKDSNQAELAILRVLGPPYYSLLQAVEPEFQENGQNTKTRVFVERAPRVWVQFGYEYPFLEQIQAPISQLLFLQADGRWRYLDEGPFRDVYQALETPLPKTPNELQESQLPSKINVSLSLASMATNEQAELWVLRDEALSQVEALVRRSDDQLLGRLSFAVSEQDESPTVVIRVRPSKKPPPSLILDGVGYCSFLKIPNLFLPIGKRLHPPLRRDVVFELLSQDNQWITWLAPVADSNSFQTERIKDAAFQPLNNWVDYVCDRNAESLQAWSDSFQFEFERFACSEDELRKPRPKTGAPKRAPKKPSLKREPESVAVRESKPEYQTNPESRDKSTNKKDSKSKTNNAINQSQLKERLEKLEAQFNQLDNPIDSPERVRLWREMANTNWRLGRRHDSTVCYANGYWTFCEDGYQAWLDGEVSFTNTSDVNEIALASLLSEKSNRPANASLVAAYLAWATRQAECPAFIRENLSELIQYLERQESFLPVRAAWLAWHSLYQLAGADVLLLARARDRILERLFQRGLTPEFDLPSFLRVKGTGDGHSRLLNEGVRELGDIVDAWMQGSIANSRTYTQLMFAFAHARLGDSTLSQSILDEAAFEMEATGDVIHKWFAKAFEERIKGAINSESTNIPFSETLLEYLDYMERLDRYKLDRLRQQSRILEPLERVDPYTQWLRRNADELSKQLAQLPGQTNREQLRNSITQLLKEHSDSVPNYSRVLRAALQLGPRTGEQFGMELVEKVFDSLKSSKTPIDDAMLIQRSMFVAAHFGQDNAVRALVSHFQKSLPGIVADYLGLQIQHKPENLEKVNAIELLFTESFRELRKLGMRDEIGDLYSKVRILVDRNAKKGSRKRTSANARIEIDSTRPWRLLLCVAGGWYYFGRDDEADKIADSVREILFTNQLPPLEQTSLASAYVKAVALAHPDRAHKRLCELFQKDKQGQSKLRNIKDSMTTSSHYSISQLSVVESTVLALVNDGESMNSESRRWLDEDEFWVRRRIHQDMQRASG